MTRNDSANITIITPIFIDPSVISQVKDLADLLSINHDINLVFSKIPETENNKIKITEIPIYYTTNMNMLDLTLAFVKTNLFICRYVLESINDSSIFLFYNTNYPFAMLLLKFKSKRVIFLPVGTISSCAKYWYRDRLRCFGKFIMPLIFNIFRSISYSLSDTIVVEYSGQLCGHPDKIFVAPFRFADKFLKKCVLSKSEISSPTIGYIGRFSEEKGIINLIRSIPIILDTISNANFILIGGGKLECNAKEMIKELGLGDKVTFPGWIDNRELNEWINQMDLVIIPSYTEGLPGVLVESIACGIPVLATPVGAIPDYIRDGETGFIMKDNSPECIAKNTIRALNDPTLKNIGNNGRLLAQKEFSRDVIISRWNDLIERD